MLPWAQAWSLRDVLGKLLRAQFAGTTNEPLPKRWVELIHYLNAQDASIKRKLREPASTGWARTE